MIKEFESFALQLADQARSIAGKYFRTEIAIDQKADATPVSIADKEIERTLRSMIRQTYPDHGVLGEEFAASAIDAEFLWVIDPIDGTKSFISGLPFFGCLISLLHHGKPILGIIEVPAINERWLGVKNQGTRFNGQNVQTRSTHNLKQAVCCTTAPDFFSTEELEMYNKISQVGPFRLFGGDCYNYGLLASGHVDVVMEAGLKPFDFMPLVAVIENAGGIVTDWQGNALSINSQGRVLACANAQLHDQCLELMDQDIET